MQQEEAEAHLHLPTNKDALFLTDWIMDLPEEEALIREWLKLKSIHRTSLGENVTSWYVTVSKETNTCCCVWKSNVNYYYFLFWQHDDRELPRRQKLDRSRARSRSPLWVHDRFDDLEGEEEQVTDHVKYAWNYILGSISDC